MNDVEETILCDFDFIDLINKDLMRQYNFSFDLMLYEDFISQSKTFYDIGLLNAEIDIIGLIREQIEYDML